MQSNEDDDQPSVSEASEEQQNVYLAQLDGAYYMSL